MFHKYLRFLLVWFVILTGLFLFRSVLLYPGAHNPSIYCGLYHRLEDYNLEQCQVNGLNFFTSIDGSGSYVSVHFMPSEFTRDWLEESLAKPELLWEWDEELRRYFLAISPKSYGEGAYLIGQFDLDAEIEVVTYPRVMNGSYSFVSNLFLLEHSILEISPDGALKAENSFLVHLTVLVIHQLFWVVILLSFPLSFFFVFLFFLDCLARIFPRAS